MAYSDMIVRHKLAPVLPKVAGGESWVTVVGPTIVRGGGVVFLRMVPCRIFFYWFLSFSNAKISGRS